MRNTAVLTAAAGAAAYILVGLPAQAEAAPGSLRLMTGSPGVQLDRDSDGWVYLDVGGYLAADKAPFEVRLNRRSYDQPIVATQIVRDGAKVTRRRLPAGLVKDFTGFPGMVRTTLTDAKGRKVLDRTAGFCPNAYEASRIRPEAPAVSKYPAGCPDNAFTLGSVQGIEGGWAAPVSGGMYGRGSMAKLPTGRYTARIWVTKPYQKALGISGAVQTVKVTVKQAAPGSRTAVQRAQAKQPPLRGHLAHLLRSQGRGETLARSAPSDLAKPRSAPPVGAAAVPAGGPRPDLRALPAFDVMIQKIAPNPKKPKVKKEYLTFAANVWNGGTSPLVVDGFRRPGKDLMDAYQYFYDAQGREAGHARTGDFKWDPRPGHVHWHFLDFANYSLVDSAKKQVVRSQKEAFCLANTDAVDYTVPYAKWKPGNTDLSTACGYQSSLSIREVLDIGSGDTYNQYLPGQSFDLAGIKNGTYYIKVLANPVRRLYELDVNNNTSYRKIVIGGKVGKRTVQVAPVGIVKETPGRS
ncbi:lysyl oxidase family protein [Actinomadura hibisca]|uniref:lysyl oxidase family protein n=1 Tax=Actinomadura hibisca TaxID=68565 RepID=UPI000AF7013F|nr:lysyl oxidase family protein [Actinomadura hibisca]